MILLNIKYYPNTSQSINDLLEQIVNEKLKEKKLKENNNKQELKSPNFKVF